MLASPALRMERGDAGVAASGVSVLQNATKTIEQSERAGMYRPVRQFYIVEGLASHAAILLLCGIFFFTHQQFQWGIRQNLTLAAGQGTVYVVGALLAGTISAKLGRRR